MAPVSRSLNPLHSGNGRMTVILQRRRTVSTIGVARGCSGCTCRAVKKIFFRRNLQVKCVSAPPGHEVHPQPEQESILGEFLLGGLDFAGIFRPSLTATTKKGRQLYWQKVHPRQYPGYAYGKHSM